MTERIPPPREVISKDNCSLDMRIVSSSTVGASRSATTGNALITEGVADSLNASRLGVISTGAEAGVLKFGAMKSFFYLVSMKLVISGEIYIGKI